ncbi:hypothetical protein BB560_001986 [Smittium megazygosporum]|uniref:DUF962 domain-containing protein n=1 Tax=Smittium megazygosporum TaxID=133381 RepID=A0A2T9ZG14_9FUNG|nr:hypothetical protein BB560_001986 [Smittium megazygosporum]
MSVNPQYTKLGYNPKGYSSLSEFYPFYLGEHSNTTCRRLHVIGTTIGLFSLSYCLYNGMYSKIPLAFIPGYAFAWAGHFAFEKNRPATFKHPFYSLASDFRLVFEVLTGKRAF